MVILHICEQIVTNKRQIAIRGEKDDDSSMSSLQEFEKLEQDLTNFGSGSESRGSLGSQDSLDVLGNNSTSGISKGKKKQILNVADDAVSVDSTTSLKDFEHMEEACKEAETIEKKAKEQEDVLSEIEEGHESQYSESDSCETLSEGGNSDDEKLVIDESKNDPQTKISRSRRRRLRLQEKQKNLQSDALKKSKD